ncbi:22844_t:CDS:2, partial [Gigaspora margarita]
LLAITLDNTTNNDTFVQELSLNLNKSNIDWDPEQIQAALNYIKDNINQLRELNSAIHTSSQRFELFENTCNACYIKCIKPILDCSTRWNSTFEMIKNGLILKS